MNIKISGISKGVSMLWMLSKITFPSTLLYSGTLVFYTYQTVTKLIIVQLMFEHSTDAIFHNYLYVIN